MNGNITTAGLKEDLQWMQRVGLGGFFLFEAGVGTPLIIDHRVSFMSDEWKNAFLFTAETSTKLGLEMGIAASPGWSATGGPWVKPQDAMKKFVWSQTLIQGGRPFKGMLPLPPTTTGPFQDVPRSAVEPGTAATPAASFYADSVVIAYRVPDDLHDALEHPARALSNAGPLEPLVLLDGQFGKSIELTFSADSSAWLCYSYSQPQTVSAVQIGAPGLRGFGAPPPPILRLEASDDGEHFRKVVELAPTGSPVRSASFAPVTARDFRVVFEPDLRPSFIDSLRVPEGVAIPTFSTPLSHYDVSEFRLFAEARINAVEEKAGFATTADYYRLDTPRLDDPKTIGAGDVVSLTDKMKPSGALDWTPPVGRWVVLRFGYTLTGHENGPAPAEATGLEVDKLDGQKVASYLDTYLGMYEAILGSGRRGSPLLRAIESDSIESGPQSWTDNLPAEFRRRRGYDLVPWMPALTGVIIGSAEQSDRFLWDFRRTLAELVAEEHYGVIASAAHRRDMKYYAEALEDHRPQLGDDMEMRSHADVPMGAMWMNPLGGTAQPTYIADLLGAASVSHVYGKGLVGAESFTSFGMPWALAPRDLKSRADLEMSLGVNQFVIHTSTHQPIVNDNKPGLALAPFLGQYFNRNETWAEMAGAWVSYLSRSSFLLQQGQFAADIAYFYGEEAPLTSLYGDAQVGMPAGYGFDFVGADAILHRLAVRDGVLVTPDNMRYRVLYLGGTSGRMTLGVLRQLKQLLEAGATVIGRRPVCSPSLSDDDTEFQMLADALWGTSKSVGVSRIGNGSLLDESNLESALMILGIQPDWQLNAISDASIAVLHRHLEDAELYFVSNRGGRPLAGSLRLRVSGKRPEVWHADSGLIERQVSYRSNSNYTDLPVHLEQDGAEFVLLRKATNSTEFKAPESTVRELSTIHGPWRLRLQAERGATQETRIENLQSWTTMQDPAIRYFSGVGVYERAFNVPSMWRSDHKRLVLDLGDVGDVAEVLINGTSLGVLWHPPFRVEITKPLKTGQNMLEIKVANLWQNRLIGDAQPGAQQKAFTTGPTYLPIAHLRPSGLLGPVRIDQLVGH